MITPLTKQETPYTRDEIIQALKNASLITGDLGYWDSG